MSDLPAPVRKFLDLSDSSLLLGADPVDAGRWDRVAVCVRDRAALRALRVSEGVRTPILGIFLTDGTGPLTLVPKPEWPALQGVRARGAAGGWLTVLRFTRGVDVATVLAELGRQSVWPDRAGNRGLRIEGVDPLAEHLPADVVAGERCLPDDLDPVTARPPLLLRDLAGPLALGPLDERVLNPIGFSASPTEPAVDLAALDLSAGVTEDLVASLRSAAGVRVTWDLPSAARTAAGLAMAGVPLISSEAPVELLGTDLAAAITEPVDLADHLAREEHSIALRRAALDTFASYAWRRTVGDLAGVPVVAHPSVSIVLATRRPEQLEFALRQVAKQQGVESLELVLAPHGFTPDIAQVRSLLPAGIALQVLAQPETTSFGDVLAAAAQASCGDVVLKMDDDDWYSADVVADLLRARAYSGAELVGMPAEFHYLAPKELTVKRGHPAECYTTFVAGGTMMIDRALLREVGNFRSVRKFVDAQLLAGVFAAGALAFRCHGFGYLLRRNASGHTWEVDMDFLLDPSRVQATYPGFSPSRLLQYDESELPAHH